MASTLPMVRSTHDILVTIGPHCRAESSSFWIAAAPRVRIGRPRGLALASGIGAKAEELRVLFIAGYFVAVAQERHFARPLRSCFYVSQPALSSAIANSNASSASPDQSPDTVSKALLREGERLVVWAQRMPAEKHAAFRPEWMRCGPEGPTGTLSARARFPPRRRPASLNCCRRFARHRWRVQESGPAGCDRALALAATAAHGIRADAVIVHPDPRQ